MLTRCQSAKKNRLLSFILLFQSFFMPVPSAQAGTTLVVGNRQTIDRSMMVAQNIDENGAFFQYQIIIHPYSFNSVENMFYSNHNHFVCEMPRKLFKYISISTVPSAETGPYPVDTVAMNEQGVFISAAEKFANHPQVLKVDPYVTETGIEIQNITRVIIPSVWTAKEGVQLLGKTITEQGAAEGFGVILADRSEIWYFETASGHRWIAFRLNPNQLFFSVHPSAHQNHMLAAHLRKSHHFLGSTDLIEFAHINGWMSSVQEEVFNFFKIYMAPPSFSTGMSSRIQRLTSLYTRKTLDPIEEDCWSGEVQPFEKLSIASVMRGLRDHSDQTVLDPYWNENVSHADAPISLFRTSVSYVTQLRSGLPLEIANILYVAFGLSDLSIYLPFYQGIEEVPNGYGGRLESSLFWQFRKLQALVMQNYPKYSLDIKKRFEQFEFECAVQQVSFELAYLSISSLHSGKAQALLKDFTAGMVEKLRQLLTECTTRLETALEKKSLSNEEYRQFIQDTEKKYHFGPV